MGAEGREGPEGVGEGLAVGVEGVTRRVMRRIPKRRGHNRRSSRWCGWAQRWCGRCVCADAVRSSWRSLQALVRKATWAGWFPRMPLPGSVACYSRSCMCPASAPFALQDWSAWPATDWQARLKDFLLRDRQQQFSPWTPPLWRVTLLMLTSDLYHCVLTFHHAILDGRSCSLVLNEVAALYRRILAAPPPTLRTPGSPVRLTTHTRQTPPGGKSAIRWRTRSSGGRHWQAVPRLWLYRKPMSRSRTRPGRAGSARERRSLSSRQLSVRHYASLHRCMT
jgi:hypothetical protein